MSMEADLVALLKTHTPHVFADTAPTTTERPYIIYQHIGGAPQRCVNGVAVTLRNSYVQIAVWHSSKSGSMGLIRQIEDDLCASSAFVARPRDEPTSQMYEDIGLYGALQTFSIWAHRE